MPRGRAHEYFGSRHMDSQWGMWRSTFAHSHPHEWGGMGRERGARAYPPSYLSRKQSQCRVRRVKISSISGAVAGQAGIWGCSNASQLSTSRGRPCLCRAPELEPWQGTGSSDASSRTCRVSVPARPVPACPHRHPQVIPQPPLPVPLAPAAPPLHPFVGSSFALGQKSPSWEPGGRGAGQAAPAVPAHPCRPAETIAELNRSYREQNLPVTDGSRELHSLCAQLEFLLQVLPPLGGTGSRGSPCQAFWGTLDDVICPWASPSIQAGGHEDWPRLHPYVEHLLLCVQREGKLRHKAGKWSCPQLCGVQLGKPAEYHRDRLGVERGPS